MITGSDPDRNPRRLRLAAFFLAFAASCAPPGEPVDSEHRFAVTEEDGVTVARTTGGPRYPGEIFEYERVLEIRPDEDRPETLFFLIAEMALDADDNLYVVDANGNRISVFDARGDWIRDIGRQGEGPGEFAFPLRVDYADGQVIVPDRRKRRTHFFSPIGEFSELRSWPDFPRRGEMGPQLWFAPGGTVVVHTMASSWIVHRLEGRTGGDVVTERTEMLLFDRDGRPTARIEGPWIRTSEWRTTEIEGDQARFQVPVYFAASPRGGYSPAHGIWLSSGESPRIDWHDLAGNLVRRVVLDLPEELVTASDRDFVHDVLEQELTKVSVPAKEEPNPRQLARIRLLARSPLFATAKPYWGTPQVDTFGYMWLPTRPDISGPVDRALAERDAARRFVRVLSPEGEYLGNTTPPTGYGYIERGHFLTTAVDPASEESYPVVYRIRPRVEGFEYGG